MGNLKKDEDKSHKKSQRKTILFSGFYSPLVSDYWSKKNGKDYLDTLFKDLLKLDYYYYSLRVFLLRNIKTTFTIFKSQQPNSTAEIRRGTSTRRFSCQDSKVSVTLEIKERRKRSLTNIINDLWTRVPQ